MRPASVYRTRVNSVTQIKKGSPFVRPRESVSSFCLRDRVFFSLITQSHGAPLEGSF